VASCKTAQSSARRPRSGTHLGTSAQTARSTKQKSLNADIVRDAHCSFRKWLRAEERPMSILLWRGPAVLVGLIGVTLLSQNASAQPKCPLGKLKAVDVVRHQLGFACPGTPKAGGVVVGVTIGILPANARLLSATGGAKAALLPLAHRAAANRIILAACRPLVNPTKLA
jgi:hypothetical protein